MSNYELSLSLVDLTTNQLLYLQPSTVDRIISEEFIIHNSELGDSCKVSDSCKVG